MQGNSAYPAYSGDASQYEVHKFMNLDPNEVGYFITQVADAAMSFGVSADDLAPVGMALNSLFGYRCAPATTVIPAQGLNSKASARLRSALSHQTPPVMVFLRVLSLLRLVVIMPLLRLRCLELLACLRALHRLLSVMVPALSA